MTDNQDKINQLLERLNVLSIRQDDFSREINNLRSEISSLNAKDTRVVTPPIAEEQISENQVATNQGNEATDSFEKDLQQWIDAPIAKTTAKVKSSTKINIDFEKFVGENLISKIGIAITVIGVAIGAKYSIENELISPLTRIILGYIAGAGLMGVGIKLKSNYENYSAVLVSGAIAILYFITFAAYDFYSLIPQVFAFGLMVLFTAFTVIAAINYNKEIIALFGLVGAYAVPFLLSDGSGNVAIMFSYMTIINIGILVLAFKKYWKKLYYTAFGLTWLIYAAWYLTDYRTTEHFAIAFTFLVIFFAVFYLTFLAYKILQKEKFEKIDIILLLTNSFIFFAIGFSVLERHDIYNQLRGLFTIANAIPHFIVTVIVYKQKLADKNLFYLILGLVLVFLTIAVPVQLDGNWVTLLWIGEAALLFWIGRAKGVPIYEKLSYPLMILAVFSIVEDWSVLYSNYWPENSESRLTPVLNINFLSSMLFIAAFSFINYININKNYTSAFVSKKDLSKLITYALPTILIGIIYFAFSMEIASYWTQLFQDSSLSIQEEGEAYAHQVHNFDLLSFKAIWLINYSLLFVAILSLINIVKIKNADLGVVNLVLNVIAIVFFLSQGLYEISELRESYLNRDLIEYFNSDTMNLAIRYISYGFFILVLASCYYYMKQDYIVQKFKHWFDVLLHTSILWIASSELINWLDLAEFSQSYKLGLSILWGVYSLFLIVYGMWKKKKHLRIGGIALFAVTLVKLFFYDIASLDTISKTIVFVSLGILLLIISFLYNKYKHVIFDEPEN